MTKSLIVAAACSASGEVWGGMWKPRFTGSAERRPFSTASVALKARMFMLFTMSSIRACGTRQYAPRIMQGLVTKN